MSTKKVIIVNVLALIAVPGIYYIGYSRGRDKFISQLINQYEDGNGPICVEAKYGATKGLLYHLKAECIGD